MKATPRSRKTARSSSKPEKFPPALQLKPVLSRVLRFRTANAVSNAPITRYSMLKLAFATDANGTQGNTCYSGVRLKRVKIWSTLISSDTAGYVNCAVEWQSLRGPTQMVSDSGNMIEPAHVDTKPPKESEASFWSQVSSGSTVLNEVLFYLTAPTDSIIDIHFCYVESNGLYVTTSNPPTETLAITSIVPPTASAFLVNSLDNTVAGVVGPNLIRAVQLNTALGF